jgi:hypothetical protein
MAWFSALMMSDVGVMVAAREFAGEIGSWVREFEGFVTAGSDPGSEALSRLGNRRSGLAQVFIEAQVRSLIEERLGKAGLGKVESRNARWFLRG